MRRASPENIRRFIKSGCLNSDYSVGVSTFWSMIFAKIVPDEPKMTIDIMISMMYRGLLPSP